jgi:hypothetical protein
MKLRFLIDENVNRAIQRQLRRIQPDIDILSIGDPGAPGAGTSDPEILIWIEENGYVLVTENRSTMPYHIAEHHASGRQFPGILWLRPAVGIGQVIEELLLIWATSEAEEFRNRSFFIPL